MTNSELRHQIEAMHHLSGKNLDNVLFKSGKKTGNSRVQDWSRKGDGWWREATTEADTKMMRKYLSDIRWEFIKKAPLEFSKEFGRDMLASSPRMIAGIAAMNVTGIVSSVGEHGFTREGFANAFGQSKEEIAANLLTAAYFTRSPHSFKVEASPGRFQKIFQTGQIEQYYKAKNN